MPPTQELTATRVMPPALNAPALAARHRVALVVLALTLLSFLWPSAPTYDPWAWIVWGREVLHFDLSTVDGPSWKPLPVLFTTPFAAFGGLAPDLWLFVARAGTIAGVVLVFRVARRLGGLPAGVVAATAYALAPWTLRNGALGNSEGLLVALALAAVDRGLAGRMRSAWGFAVAAALLRPEAWPFLGVFGLWLAWREPSLRALVAAGLLAQPLLWLLPELWGSGDLLRAAHRAHSPNPNSAAFADNPVQAVLEQFNQMLNPAMWAGLGALAILAVARRAPGRRELLVAGAMLGAAVVWVLEVAVMTSDGYSGNARYLILPAAIVCVLAGTAIGWAAPAVATLVRGRRRTAALGVAAAAAAFAAPNVTGIVPTANSLKYQARLMDGLGKAVHRAGGAKRLLACGDPYSGPFQVPAVAWRLRVHTSRVHLNPIRPAVVFRTRTTTRSVPGPPVDAIGGEPALTTFAIASGWRIVGVCRGGAA